MNKPEHDLAVRNACQTLACIDGYDQEDAHYKADAALLTFLRAIGEERVAKEFEATRDRVGFWYA